MGGEETRHHPADSLLANWSLLTYCNDISRHEEYSHYTPDPAMYCVVAVVMTGVVDGCQQTTQEMQFNHDENPLAAPLKASHC